MRKLRLDFQQSGVTRNNGVGWVLLIIGLLLVVVMVRSHNSIRVEREHIQSELTRLQNISSQRNSKGEKDGGASLEFEQAEKVIEQLSFPWNRLFEAIENSAGGGVALLAVLPDISTKTLELNGEAKNWNSLVSYIKRLEAEQFFRNVELVNHQIQQTDPQHPIRFKLNCAWLNTPILNSVSSPMSTPIATQPAP